MRFNKKMIAASIVSAMALTGCGSESGSSTSTSATTVDSNPTVTNEFIDAAVEGLYYKALPSGLSGYTTTSGGYTAKANDTVTFYLGGPNGLKIGAASNRDVITPFEAAGKYNRAKNLAVVLQSLDEASGDDVLSVPASLQGTIDTTAAQSLAKLRLDDSDSVSTFLSDMSATAVSEDTALNHMKTAFGSRSRGSTNANPFALGSNKIVRYIDVNQNVTYSGNTYKFVHADKTLATDIFENTRGMTSMNLQVESDGVRELAGSNDFSLNESFGEEYLTCVINEGTFVEGDSTNTCDGSPITINSSVNLMADNVYAYSMINKSGERTSDAADADEGDYLPFSATTIQDLNKYEVGTPYDDYPEEEGGWQKDITSGSYDSTTGVYTEIVKKVEYQNTDDNCDTNPSGCTVNRTTERVAFYYEVDDVNDEKYVDFTGAWVENEICTDGSKSELTYVFSDTGISVSGTECQSGSAVDHGNYSETYAEAATGDMWWFDQTDRAAKATLTELNSTVRWCDDENFNPGDTCNTNDEYFIKWEYQPAGADWDQGLLIRRKMDVNGNSQADGGVSIYQKIN